MESNDIFYLYLIRHGITSWNQEKRYLGHTDISVIDKELMNFNSLKNFFQNQSTKFILCSDLIRCKQTASFLFPKSSVEYDKRLREMDFGSWEGLTYEQLKGNLSYRKWIDNWERHAPEHGECGFMFKKRINDYLNEAVYPKIEYKKDGKVGVIVTHGGVIRLLITILNPQLSYWDVLIPFGKAQRLKLVKKGEKWICESLSVVPIQEKDNL